jgi:hypothetical protein
MTESHKLRRNDHPDTSHESAEQVDSERFEMLAYEIVLEHGLRGCTLDDLEDGFAKRAPPGTQFANRRTGIHQKGLILDTGDRRVGRKNRRQAIYVARKLLTEELLIYIKNHPDAHNPCLDPESEKEPRLGDGTSDAALAIGEHAFRAGFEAGADWGHKRVGHRPSALAVAWSDYDPPEDIKALS